MLKRFRYPKKPFKKQHSLTISSLKIQHFVKLFQVLILSLLPFTTINKKIVKKKPWQALIENHPFTKLLTPNPSHLFIIKLII
jgi:hypothetical protein